MSIEICESINDAKKTADESKTRFSNNNKSHAPNNNQHDNRNSLSKTSTIAEIAGLPPLIISKYPLRTPGLSNKHSSTKQQNRQSAIYTSKTVKRTSTETDNNNSINNQSSSTSGFLDESFSTQDLRDITNKELLMNSSKRVKF
jgi:hypothetical protein